MSYMHFTTQQLQGGGKYSAKTKIGNWYEDMVMEEIKFKDYIAKKEANQLLLNKQTANPNQANNQSIPQNGFQQTGLNQPIPEQK